MNNKFIDCDQEVSVFYCDFDGLNTCSGELETTGSGLGHSLIFGSRQIILTTTVTDITSISKK